MEDEKNNMDYGRINIDSSIINMISSINYMDCSTNYIDSSIIHIVCNGNSIVSFENHPCFMRIWHEKTVLSVYMLNLSLLRTINAK